MDLTPMWESLAERSLKSNPEVEGDYYDEDGIMRCGKCKTPKRGWKLYGTDENKKKYYVGILCRCKQEELEEQELSERREKALKKHKAIVGEYLLRSNIPSRYTGFSFVTDDDKESKISKTLRKWCSEKWNEVSEKRLGLMLYGACGTGKTYYAICIAKELIEKEVPVYFATAGDFLNGSFKDNDEKLNSLRNYAVVILDDFGAERDTEYANEVMFKVIDYLTREDKLVVVTTNEFPKDIAAKQKQSVTSQRLYDRLAELCPVQIEVTGESKRRKQREDKLNYARELFSE